jgi:hypothetical protein
LPLTANVNKGVLITLKRPMTELGCSVVAIAT